jgi:O-antigen/teichoic acid export membrane protein
MISTPAVAAQPSTEADALHGKGQIIADFLALGVSRYAAFGLSFVASIIQRRVLGPYIIGIWQLLSVCRIYLSYWDAGISRGAEQRLPALLATDAADAARYRDTAYTWVLGTMVAGNLLVLGASFLSTFGVDPLVLWGVRGMTIIAMVEGFSNMMEASALRAPARFRLMSLQLLISEVLFALLSVPAALAGGLAGLLVALFISMASKPVFMRLATGESFHVRVDRPRAAALLHIGFPLTVFTVIYKTFDTVDRVWVLQGGGIEALGYYSIASMALVFIAQFPQVIATVFLPRTITRYAVSSDESMMRYFQQAQLCMIAGAGIATAACYFVLPPVMTWLLPSFTPGVPALKISVFSAVFVGAAQLPIQYLIAARRQWALAAVIALATAIYYGVGWFLAAWIGGTPQWLAVVAWGRVLAFLLLAALMTLWTMTLQPSMSWRWFAETSAVAAYVVWLPALIDDIGGTAAGAAGELGLGVLRLVVFGLATLPVAWLVERRTAALSHAVALCRRRGR